MKHTPGPWKLRGYFGESVRVVVDLDDRQMTVAKISDCGYAKHEAANANLIAAAPDLLDAAEGMIAAIDAVQDTSQPIPSHLAAYYGSMRAAIAKARGEV